MQRRGGDKALGLSACQGRHPLPHVGTAGNQAPDYLRFAVMPAQLAESTTKQSKQ